MYKMSFFGGGDGAAANDGDQTPQFLTENADQGLNMNNINYFKDTESLMDQRDFFRNFDKQVNKRIAKGIKQGLQLLIKKMDAIIDLKVDIVLKEMEQK